jgi:hypothetical protein
MKAKKLFLFLGGFSGRGEFIQLRGWLFGQKTLIISIV